MSGVENTQTLDREELRRLFDLRSSYNAHSGGGYTDDPYPRWAELREQAPVHEGIVHTLTGFPGDAMFQGLPFPDRPHFSAFSYEACDAAFRDPEVFASSPDAGGPGRRRHQRGRQHVVDGWYRAPALPLARPAVIRAREGAVVVRELDRAHGEPARRRDRRRWSRRAQRRLLRPRSRCSRSPAASAYRSSRHSIIRQSLSQPMEIVAMLEPIVAARREQLSDDLISVLVEAEYTDDDGVTHQLSDPEIYSFAHAAARRRFRHHVEADGHHPRRAACSDPMRSTR